MVKPKLVYAFDALTRYIRSNGQFPSRCPPIPTPSSPNTRAKRSTVSHLPHTRVYLNAVPSAIVEQVRDGTQMRIRLLLDEHNHQFINLASSLQYRPSVAYKQFQVVAGAKSPRAGNARDGYASTSEPWGKEVRDSPVPGSHLTVF